MGKKVWDSGFVYEKKDGSKWSPEAGGYVKNGKITSRKAEYEDVKSNTSASDRTNDLNRKSSSKSSTKKSSSKDSGRSAREKAYDDFDGWSNVKEIRDLQKQWWEKYVDTGENDRDIHEKAEQIRKSINARYEGDEDGPSSKKEANQIIPKELLKYAQEIQDMDFSNVALPFNSEGGEGGSSNMFWIVAGAIALLLFRK